MANHFSALKRARQTVKRTANNRANTTRLRTELRKLRETMATGDAKAAKETFSATVSMIDKACVEVKTFLDFHDDSCGDLPLAGASPGLPDSLGVTCFWLIPSCSLTAPRRRL